MLIFVMTYGTLSDSRFKCKYMVGLCMYITFYIRNANVHTKDSVTTTRLCFIFYVFICSATITSSYK